MNHDQEFVGVLTFPVFNQTKFGTERVIKKTCKLF